MEGAHTAEKGYANGVKYNGSAMQLGLEQTVDATI